MSEKQIIISCEHGDNHIPSDLQTLFRNSTNELLSHKGWDPGALELAQKIASGLDAPLFHEKISRLVIEQNRSLHHRNLFSKITSKLPNWEKQKLIREIYHPYRRKIESAIETSIRITQRVYHFSIHTFTPELNGLVRQTDIGLLYNSNHPEEKNVCIQISRQLSKILPDFRIRRNYPYNGSDDGITTGMRRKFEKDKYCGIEIEVNQKFHKTMLWSDIGDAITEVIKKQIR